MKKVILCITFLFFMHCYSSQSYSNELSGQVINKSNNTPVPNLTLGIIEHSSTKDIPVKYSTITNDDGYFLFSGLSGEPSYSYFITFTYKDIPYIVENLKFASPDEPLTLEIPTFGTTTDDKNISVKLHEMYINYHKNDNYLVIKEKIILVNKGSEVYLGKNELSHGKRETYHIQLPRGFYDIKYLRGLNNSYAYHSRPGIMLIIPLKPGKREFVFSYRMKILSNEVTIERKFSSYTRSFDVFIEQKQRTAFKTQLLTSGTSMMINEVEYKNLDRDNIKKGEKVQLTIQITPATNLYHAIALITVLALLITGVWFQKKVNH